jgi:phage-related protein
MTSGEKVLAWLHGEIKTPPFSDEARRETGWLLRRLQRGEILQLPHSRSMPDIGPRCHELRIKDVSGDWRVIYRIDADVVLIVDVFHKKARKTPLQVIETCRRRLREYDAT